MFHRLQHKYAPYLFITPFVVVFLTFGLYPLVKSFVLALYITSGPRARVFAGLENYRFLWRDPDFHKAVFNTAVYTLCSVGIQLPLSLGLALLLNRKRLRGRNLFRFVFFSPTLLGAVFVGVLFALIFAPDAGLLNRTLHAVTHGAFDKNFRWLGDPRYVMPALVMTALWLYVGFNMIYFLAALQGVDPELYDAARVDGAGRWRQFLHVTLPGIKHVAVIVVLLSTISSFQLFELPYVMLNQSAGPGGAGLTVVMYLYQSGFAAGDLGYAAAIGWTLALGVMAVALAQLWSSGTFKKGA